MTKVHTCETHYNVKPPVDINPLLLQVYGKKDKLLVLCAREGMVQRISMMKENDGYKGPKLEVVGVWDAIDKEIFVNGKANVALLKKFNAVVIIGKSRAYEGYKAILDSVERAVKSI